MSNDLFEDSQESSPEPCKYVNSKYKFFEVLLHQLPQKPPKRAFRNFIV